PATRSHTRTLPSPSSEARRLPSRLKATSYTSPSCSLQVNTTSPVATSQSFTVLSALAEASRLLSGLNATARTELVWPCFPRKSWSSLPVTASQTKILRSSPAEASSLPSRL